MSYPAEVGLWSGRLRQNYHMMGTAEAAADVGEGAGLSPRALEERVVRATTTPSSGIVAGIPTVLSVCTIYGISSFFLPRARCAHTWKNCNISK